MEISNTIQIADLPLIVCPLAWKSGDDDTNAYAMVGGKRVPLNTYLGGLGDGTIKVKLTTGHAVLHVRMTK